MKQKVHCHFVKVSNFSVKLLLLIFTQLFAIGCWAATYYSQVTGTANTLANWNSSRTGGGSTPTNFTTANDVFVIQNGHNMSTGAAWALTGSRERLQIESGGTLTANHFVTFNTSGSNSGTFQVDNGGTYIHNIVSGTANGTNADFPGFSTGNTTLGATSRVVFLRWANGGTSPAALPSLAFGNLTINVATLGGSWNQIGVVTSVRGNLTIISTGGGSFEFRLAGTTAYTLIIGGDLIVQGGILNMSSAATTNKHVIRLAGNYNQSGGTFTNSNTGAGNPDSLAFTGAAKTFTQTAGTFTNTNVNFSIYPTASLRLVNALSLATSRTMTVSGTLETDVTYTSNGTTTINGTFMINEGGFASGNNFVYSTTATLVFNNSSGAYGVSGTPAYWPVTSGPNNVTVLGAGGINMSVARTVPSSGITGTFLLVTATNGVQGTALTLNGTVQINGGNFQTTPTYGSSSTLIYNISYGTSNEWTGGATNSVAAGSGIPANVTVQSGTLTLAGGRGVPGNITVNSGSDFILNAAGDLYIGGNLTNNGTTWTNNNKAVFFVGGGTQTITAGSGTQFFDYLVLDKTGGTVQIASSTNITINSTAGDVLQILNAGTLNLNGRTLTLNNTGGNIFTSGGARTITSTVANGLLDITAAKSVTAASGGTLSFGTNVTIAIAAGVDFGSALSTINGTLRINTGGSCSINSPIYGSGSTLVYNTGNFITSNEWIAGGSIGTGVPSKITLTLASSSNAVTLTGSRSVPGTLTLTTGDVIIGSNILTAATITRTSGNLQGSITSELVITGTGSNLFFNNPGSNNFLKNFTLNNGATATLGNALNITDFDGVSSEGVLTVTGTATLTTGGFLTIKSTANGTARIAAGRTTGGYISGNVTVERFIPQNSSKGWRLLASTTSGQTINQAWQEGVVGAMNNPNPGFGTKITAGNSITTNLATAQAAGFDSLSLGISLFRYNATTDGLEAVTATNTGNIGNEHGYFLFLRGDRSPGQFGAGAPTTSTVLRSRGTLFTGDQLAVATGASNYGLVRNPYPSRIDMKNIVRGTNLIDAYQVWDSKLGGTYGVGGFQTFTKSGADYVVAPGGGSYGSNGSIHNFIESGAAFFIQSTTNTNNTAQVTEACKTSASNTNSFRPSGVQAVDKRLTYTLYALNPGSTDVVDGGIVFFNDTYSNSVTVEDVRKSGNFNENFGMLRENTDLVVEKRKNVLAKDSIFFKMYQLRQISYRIDFETLNFDPVVTTAVLQDNFTNTNTTIDLTTLTSYTFTVNATAGTFAQNRFKLVFSSSNTFTGNGTWTDNARWSRGTPPAPGETVIIAAGANAELDTDYTAGGSLTMTPTSSLTVNPTRTLSISGTADFAGQSVTFKSDNTGTASLGQVTGTVTGATNVTVERYIRNNNFRSWRLLSVPVTTSQTIRQAWQEGDANPNPKDNNVAGYGTQITGVFTTQAAATAAGFDSTSVLAGMLRWNGAGWSNITSTNQPINNFNSYFLYIRGDRSLTVTGMSNASNATTLRTKGTIFTGDQVTNVGAGAFALVPNLYPSAINFTGLTRTGGVNNLFYIWDSKKLSGSSLGVYQTFSGTNGHLCMISGGSYTLGQPNTTIESGQSFFVTSGAAGTITLKETAKISNTNGSLGFRPTPSAVKSKLDSRLFNSSNEMLDANTVVFDAVYSKAVAGEDAPKMGNPDANFAIEADSKLLAIAGTAPVKENDVIQFRMWNLKQQEYKLEFAATRMDVGGLHAMLEDKYLGIATEINTQSNTVIPFTVDNNPASSAANRFRIVFSKTTTVTEKPSYTISPNPATGNTVYLQFKNQPAGLYRIKLSGVEGKIVATRIINHAGGTANNAILLPASTAAGNYQLEITTPLKNRVVKQLVVSK